PRRGGARPSSPDSGRAGLLLVAALAFAALALGRLAIRRLCLGAGGGRGLLLAFAALALAALAFGRLGGFLRELVAGLELGQPERVARVRRGGHRAGDDGCAKDCGQRPDAVALHLDTPRVWLNGSRGPCRLVSA